MGLGPEPRWLGASFLFFFLGGFVMVELYLWCGLVSVTYMAVVSLINSKSY